MPDARLYTTSVASAAAVASDQAQCNNIIYNTYTFSTPSQSYMIIIIIPYYNIIIIIIIRIYATAGIQLAYIQNKHRPFITHKYKI